MKVDNSGSKNEPFFLTSNGDAASVTRHTFKMFASSVGLPTASSNTLRKGLTTNLRKNPSMSEKEPIIMDHSKKTSDAYYDQGRTLEQVIRTTYIHIMFTYYQGCGETLVK